MISKNSMNTPNSMPLVVPTTVSIDSSSSGSDDILARLVQAAVRKSLAADPESVAFSADGTSFVRNSTLTVVGRISDDEISALSCPDALDWMIGDDEGENDVPTGEDTPMENSAPISAALLEKVTEELNGGASAWPSEGAKWSDDIVARLVKSAVAERLSEYQHVLALSSFELPDDASALTDDTCLALSTFRFPDDASAMTDDTCWNIPRPIPDSVGVRPSRDLAT